MMLLHFSFLWSLSLLTLTLSLSSEMTSHPVFAVLALAAMVNLITMVTGWVMTIHPPDYFFFGFVQLLAFDVCGRQRTAKWRLMDGTRGHTVALCE